MIIDGRKIAGEILDELKNRVEKLKSKGITPHLAIILVGKDPQSESYVSQKELKGTKIGAKISVKRLALSVKTQKLLRTIEQLNNDSNVHGIIVQRPLPPHISSEEIDKAVIPAKDVDGFHPDSPYRPPIAAAVLKILESIDKNFLNKKIVVIGKGKTGGGPIIKSLIKLGAYVQVVDSSTPNSSFIIHHSEIIISSVGKQDIVKPEMIKDGVFLISVGLNKGKDDKLHGDYEEEKIKDIALYYTPTPGGVGPVNVACLLQNLVKAAEIFYLKSSL